MYSVALISTRITRWKTTISEHMELLGETLQSQSSSKHALSCNMFYTHLADVLIHLTPAQKHAFEHETFSMLPLHDSSSPILPVARTVDSSSAMMDHRSQRGKRHTICLLIPRRAVHRKVPRSVSFGPLWTPVQLIHAASWSLMPLVSAVVQFHILQPHSNPTLPSLRPFDFLPKQVCHLGALRLGEADVADGKVLGELESKLQVHAQSSLVPLYRFCDTPGSGSKSIDDLRRRIGTCWSCAE